MIDHAETSLDTLVAEDRSKAGTPRMAWLAAAVAAVALIAASTLWTTEPRTPRAAHADATHFLGDAR